MTVSSARHIPSLDGIRAISFLLVFASHCGLDYLVPGGFGVTIFFFLSGFLITTLMRSEFDKNGFVSLRHFWLRRALRILPPFYLVLGGAILASLIFDPLRPLLPKAFAAQALHVSNYWIIAHAQLGLPAGTDVYWSLAVEEHFYLVFPFLYILMRKLQLTGRVQATVLWTLCAAVLAWRCVLVYGWHAPSIRTYIGTDTRIDSILFGCALAVWNNPVLDNLRLPERPWKYLIVPLALMTIAASLLERDPAFRETFRYSLQSAALTPIFMAAICFYQWLPFRLLNLRVMIFLGLLSYSLYLVHHAVLLAIGQYAPALPGLLQACLGLAISLALSWALYILVERPCAALRRKLTD